MPDMFQIGEDDVALAKGGTIGRSRRHYRRDRDLPRLVGESVTPLPPPGPDYTIRLLSLLSGLATRTPAHPSGRLCPSAAAAYAALAGELALIDDAISRNHHKLLVFNDIY